MSNLPAALRGLSNEAELEAAYREFPDQTEPMSADPIAGHSGHPLGKITVDRGPERYGFLRGVKWARDNPALPNPKTTGSDL